MEGSSVLGADQDKNGVYPGDFGEYDAVPTTGQEKAEMFLAVDDNVRYGQEGILDCGAFPLTLKQQLFDDLGQNHMEIIVIIVGWILFSILKGIQNF